ncbi:hypothetical protein IQ269_09575 [Tychonema sp. LEGE 07199]|uniref:hypothetical protein n=1 Tax=Microcoleaceae TaxID=1892252 RepID=UPI00187EEEF0|nr:MULTISPECIES: hypothetical protein [unclassified Tychonema]MBE9121060.1 hypothetical protein [Tychonema sp. LEGE 07199]MBE9133483.1 hypothetical protein [Tychonema sp. LEGE 07196]
MLKQMCWLPRLGGNGEKILHLRTELRQAWRPYTAFPQFAASDYLEKDGSKGWATFQKLTTQGWNLISTEEGQQSFFDQQKSA